MNYRRLFALSAEVGELVQRNTRDPKDGVMVIMIALGRLAAREGFEDLTAESREVFTHPDVWEAYKAGFDDERARGRKGRPRQM